eukprot:jgi/Ulvmu1/2599/UM014_0050.1
MAAASFDDYDFDGDQEWEAFVSKIELTGTDQAAQLRRVKAKYFKKHVDPTFQLPSTAVPPAAEAPPPDERSSQPETEPAQTQQPAQPTTSAPSAAAVPSAVSTLSMLPGVNAVLQAGLIGLLLAFLVTMVIQRAHQNRQAYTRFMQVALMSHLLRIASSVGPPPFKPFSMPAIQNWFARVSLTSDSHYAMVCFMFLGQPATLAAMISSFVFAGLRLASYIKRHYPGIARPVLPLLNAALARKEEAFLLMAVADISLLGVLVIRMFTIRALLFPFIYANMLRKRYQSPSSAKYHRLVWGVIGKYTQPIVSRLPLPIKRYVDMGVDFFTGRQAARTQ